MRRSSDFTHQQRVHINVTRYTVPTASLSCPDVSKGLNIYTVYPRSVLLTWIQFKNKIYVDSACEGFTVKEPEEIGKKNPISFLFGFRKSYNSSNVW